MIKHALLFCMNHAEAQIWELIFLLHVEEDQIQLFLLS